MTKLDRILEGIERCPLTNNQKHKCMLTVLFAADSTGRLHEHTTGAPGQDLASGFDWSTSLLGFDRCVALYNKIVVHG